MDFSVLAEHRIKLEESEKKDKYFDFTKELKKKKRRNIKMTIITMVIGAFSKGLFKGLEDLEVGGRGKTIKITEFLRTTRILRWVLEIWGELPSLKLQRKTIS